MLEGPAPTMGDEFFAGKAGPAVTSAAAAAAANAARGTDMPVPALNLSDAHSPMKVPVPEKNKKGGGRGSKTPQRKAAAPAAPEYDPALAAFAQYPPPYGMAPSPYPPAPAGSMAPCPMPCPPMPAMYPMMPFMYPPMYPGMPAAQPPPPQPTADKGRGKQAQGKSQKDSSKKRRGKAKGSKETTPASQVEVDPNCSPELLAVRSAQGNAVRAKVTLQEAQHSGCCSCTAFKQLLSLGSDRHFHTSWSSHKISTGAAFCRTNWTKPAPKKAACQEDHFALGPELQQLLRTSRLRGNMF